MEKRDVFVTIDGGSTWAGRLRDISSRSISPRTPSWATR